MDVGCWIFIPSTNIYHGQLDARSHPNLWTQQQLEEQVHTFLELLFK